MSEEIENPNRPALQAACPVPAADCQVATTEKLAADLLFGAGAIADELGVPVRKAFYLLEEGLIPGSKIGRTWTGSRRDLREHFAKLPRPTPRLRKTKPAAAKRARKTVAA